MSYGFRYDNMIDVLSSNKAAFQKCVKQLYPFMNYNVMQESDVRPVDLKEYFSSIEELLPASFNGPKGTFDSYMYILKCYLDQIDCQSGTRAALYKARAYELIEESKTAKKLYLAYDALMITLSLFRSYSDLEKYKERLIIDINLDVRLYDTTLLGLVCLSENLIPKGMVENKQGKKDTDSVKYDSMRVMLFFYKNSALLLHLMLLDRGLFEEGDDE